MASSQQTPEEREGALRTLYNRTVLTWRLFFDRRVGFWAKLIPFMTVAYILSPLDFIPELIVGPIGVLDDIGILIGGLTLFIEASPPDIVKEHLRALRAGLSSNSYDYDEDVVDSYAEVIDE